MAIDDERFGAAEGWSLHLPDVNRGDFSRLFESGIVVWSIKARMGSEIFLFVTRVLRKLSAADSPSEY